METVILLSLLMIVVGIAVSAAMGASDIGVDAISAYRGARFGHYVFDLDLLDDYVLIHLSDSPLLCLAICPTRLLLLR